MGKPSRREAGIDLGLAQFDVRGGGQAGRARIGQTESVSRAEYQAGCLP